MKETYEMVLRVAVDRTEHDAPQDWDWCDLLDMHYDDFKIISSRLVQSDNNDREGNVVALDAGFTKRQLSKKAKGRGMTPGGQVDGGGGEDTGVGEDGGGGGSADL